MPSIDGTTGRGLTSPLNMSGGTENHDQRIAFSERKWTGTATPAFHRDEHESTGKQSQTIENVNNRELTREGI